MPTLAELQTSCARDLRDPQKKTFTDPYLADFINAGVEEVGRVYPREALLTIPIVAGTYVYTPASPLQQAFRIEVWNGGALKGVLENGADAESSQAGWELWAGALRLPKGTVDGLSAADSLQVWGYQGYPTLVAPTDQSFLDQSAEQGVRRYVRSVAYQQLQGDRALFKQWQAASQNSDVSLNMLSQLTGFYSSEWDRTRNYLRRLRRA